jgi:hypothetical protein
VERQQALMAEQQALIADQQKNIAELKARGVAPAYAP